MLVFLKLVLLLLLLLLLCCSSVTIILAMSKNGETIRTKFLVLLAE